MTRPLSTKLPLIVRLPGCCARPSRRELSPFETRACVLRDASLRLAPQDDTSQDDTSQDDTSQDDTSQDDTLLRVTLLRMTRIGTNQGPDWTSPLSGDTQGRL